MRWIFDHFYFILFIGSTLYFIVSLMIDARRFRNAIFLFLSLISGAILLLQHTSGSTIGPLVRILFLLFFIFLFFLVPVLLIVNGFIMIKREGFKLTSLLPILFSIMIILGEVALIYAVLFFPQNPSERVLSYVALFFGFAIFYASTIFLAFMTYSVCLRFVPKKLDYDYVVVLGCGLVDGELVGKLLGNRIDKAIQIYENSMTDCHFVCSGGQGGDEKISEAEAMRNYLIRQGIPERSIILENTSTNTEENLRNSKAIIDARPGRKRIAIVSSEYHILRALIYAHDLDFPVTGFGGRTAFYYWPSAMIREYVAIVKHYSFLYITFYLFGALLLFALLYTTRM